MAIVVNNATSFQTMEGFGVDLACIPAPGISDSVADLLFTTLGIVWCRLRASVVDGSIPGWLLIGTNDNGGHVASAIKARDRGARFWALCDSNTIPAGWKSGRTILTSKYADFAAGTAAIPGQAEALGLDVEFISLANEPEGEWEPDINGTVAHDLIAEIGPLLPAGVKMILPETISATSVPSYTDPTLNDATTRQYVGRVGTHVYWGTASGPYSTAVTHGIPVWQTEYNEGGGIADATMTSALTVAAKMHTCLATCDYSMFGFFLVAGLPAFDGSRYGLLGDNYTSTKRVYAFGNFSKFVRPGYQRVGCSGAPSNVSVTAYRGSGGERVVVAINQNISNTAVDFTGLDGLEALTPWVTDATRDLAQQSDAAVTAGALSYTLPAQSVVTFVGTSTVVDVVGSSLNAVASITSGSLSFPYATRLSLPGPLKVWNGTQLVDAPLRAFDGSILS